MPGSNAPTGRSSAEAEAPGPLRTTGFKRHRFHQNSRTSFGADAQIYLTCRLWNHPSRADKARVGARLPSLVGSPRRLAKSLSASHHGLPDRIGRNHPLMNTPVLTSIIMPVFNSEKTLRDSVRSIQAQTVGDWELVLIDDRSRDTSRSLILELATEEPRIRPLLLETNVGAALARNAGLELAQGRFVAFLDSDDLWFPHKLERQLETMERTGAGLSFTDYEWIDPGGSKLGVVVRASDRPTWNELTWGNNIGLSTSMLDTTKVGKPPMRNLRLNHDFALWLELLRKRCLAVRVPEVLVRYRVLPGSLSQNKFESAWLNWVILHRIEGLSMIRTIPRLCVWALRTSLRRFMRSIPGR